MKAIETDAKKATFWQRIFLQSKVNGAPYHGEQLTGRHWNWPKDTYLQRRLQQMRWGQTFDRAA